MSDQDDLLLREVAALRRELGDARAEIVARLEITQDGIGPASALDPRTTGADRPTSDSRPGHQSSSASGSGSDRARGPVRALAGSGLLRGPRAIAGIIRATFQPNPLFDQAWYLSQNRDVRDAGSSPYRHYIRHGADEGRDPNPFFRTTWYLERNPDVHVAGKSPLDHYLRHGAEEGRDPSSLFDTDWYLAQNPDVGESGMNPLLHYLRHGQQEGRSPRPAGPSLSGRPDEVTSTFGLAGNPGVRVEKTRRARPPKLPARHWLGRLSPDPVPPGSQVLVLSGGDERWLRISEVTARHLPQGSDGRYPSVESDSATAVIAQLEWLRTQGASFLVVPYEASGPIKRLPELRRYIASRYPVIASEPGIGALHDLRTTAAAPSGATDILASVVVESRSRTGTSPSVMDQTRQHVAAMQPGVALVRAEDTASMGFWPEKSVDMVVVDAGDAQVIAEAQRIAISAVVHVDGDGPSLTATVDWTDRIRSGSASVSIVIPNYEGLPLLRGCLASLQDTLPAWETIEVLVVDDASPGVAMADLERVVATLACARLIVNQQNGGFLASANRGAAAATGDLLVFLNNDTVVLPGWLEAMSQTFVRYPKAGVVGGRLIFPDGRLQEAGGLVFRDGSAAKFGYGEPDPDAALYAFVRDTDYVSGALLATPRVLFRSLEGFDPAYGFGYYEDTDYCFRARRAGWRVLYQPDATVIHVEGATAGTDTSVGPKRSQVANQIRFAARWAGELGSQPARPQTRRPEDWYAAALRSPAAVGGQS